MLFVQMGLRVEASAVVANADDQNLISQVKPDFRLGRVGVADQIGKGFAHTQRELVPGVGVDGEFRDFLWNFQPHFHLGMHGQERFDFVGQELRNR